MGALIDFGPRQPARLGVDVTILGDEEDALLGCAQGIVRAKNHGGGGFADCSGPDARLSRKVAGAQRFGRATPPADACHARLEQLQQQLPARIDRCHGVTGAGATSAAYDLEGPVLAAPARLRRIRAFELQFLKILRRYVSGHILP